MKLKLNPISIALQLCTLQAAPSTFDVGSFAAGSFEGEGDTRRFQYPPKDYNAVVIGPFGEDKKSRIEVSQKGAVQLILVWQPDDPALQNELKLEKLPVLIQRVFLDVGEDGRSLDMGPFKNADLNKLREVFGLNRQGMRWSFADFVGKAARVTVEHRPNKDNPNEPYVNVTKVVAL